jgi:flagellar protein FliL
MAESASPTDDRNSDKSSFKTIMLSGLLAVVLGVSSGFSVGYFTYVTPPAVVTPSNAQSPAEQSPEASPEDKAVAEEETARAADGDHVKPADGKAKATEDKHGAGPALTGNISLEPIVTNLASPKDMWIRLELVLASTEPLEPDLVLQIHEDLFAFVHAMHMSEMTGPSALIDLKSELLARSKQRSGGRIKKIYIKTLLFE